MAGTCVCHGVSREISMTEDIPGHVPSLAKHVPGTREKQQRERGFTK